MRVKEATDEQTAVTPAPLTPVLIEQMIEQRQLWQIVKFRTTCTDCVPNY